MQMTNRYGGVRKRTFRFLTTLLITLVIVPLITASTVYAQDQIRFGNNKIELCFDSQTGSWLYMKDAETGKIICDKGQHLPAIRIVTDGRENQKKLSKNEFYAGRDRLWRLVDTKTFGSNSKLISVKELTEKENQSLIIDVAEGDWHIQYRYDLADNCDTLERRVRLTWTGKNQTLLRWVELAVPMPVPLDDCILEAPGYPKILHQKLNELPIGKWPILRDRQDRDLPAWRAGLMMIRKQNTNLLIWGYNEKIPSLILANRNEAGVWFLQKFFASCRLNKGQTVEVGVQYIALRKGDYKKVAGKFAKFWDKMGVKRAGSVPDWAMNARIYEVFIGYYLSPAQAVAQKGLSDESTMLPYPTAKALIADLPRIAELGFNIIQLMPHRPYPSYSVHDYMDIEAQYTNPEDLKRIVNRAHELHLKVTFDVVMHGVVDKSVFPHGLLSPYKVHPWLAEHPQWFSYTQDGRVAKTFTWSFDHANESYRDYIAGVFRYYVKEFDVDGFRVDALTWSFFPNWAKGLDRPGYDSFYGSLGIFERVRKETRQLKSDLLFITESTGPLYHKCFDLSYNYDELWYEPWIIPPASSGVKWQRKINAHQLADWLELQKLAFPRGWRKVRQADSHDSYQMNGGMYKKEKYSPEAARLLFAMYSFLDSGVMNFAGAEKGSEDFYRKVNLLHKQNPCFTKGTIHYTAARSSNNRVLCVLYRYKDEWSLPVFSFSSEPEKTLIPLEALDLKPDQKYELYEEFSGMRYCAKGSELKSLSLLIDPFGVQLWTGKIILEPQGVNK
jgi:hypothetical protein